MSKRAKKRRKAREGDYDRKMVTVKDQKALLAAYHEQFVDPRIQFLEEYVFSRCAMHAGGIRRTIKSWSRRHDRDPS